MTENKEFWRTMREGRPEGRFEFYDQETKAKGSAVVINGHVASIHLKEGPAGWTFNWGSISHWRPENQKYKVTN